jgi:solute carrier family 25 aspartate/glutamate transporter 12/13
MHDFLNHSASKTRYGTFSPMEASIIFHFAGRGSGAQRLALIDFAQLLDPTWQAPAEIAKPAVSKATSIGAGILQSSYNFGLGGIAGAVGATIVYPIDLGEI